MRAHTCTHYTPVMVCEVFVDMPSLVANRLTAVVAPGQILNLRGERGLEVDTHAHTDGYTRDACACLHSNNTTEQQHRPVASQHNTYIVPYTLSPCTRKFPGCMACIYT